MKPIALSRFLGWFSLGLGVVEVLAPSCLVRTLGLRISPRMVQGFGAREIVAGAIVLSNPASAVGPGLRLAGDGFDIAVLSAASDRSNTKRGAAITALVMVLGVTALDAVCTFALATANSSRKS